MSTATPMQAAAPLIPSRAPRAVIALALAAWAVAAVAVTVPDALTFGEAAGRDAAGSPASVPEATTTAFETRVGGYGGTAYTHPSAVRISNPPATEMMVRDFEWIGRPFKSPIYYGLRAQRLPTGMGLGGMFDFTHAKAIAHADSIATFSGTRNNQPLPAKAAIGDVFRHLEFSHGHNILTLNGLWRTPAIVGALRPYFGAGAGITLPHTEVGFKGDNARTYEYQFAGFAGQALAGLEIAIGPAVLFIEYKFTYAPYSVPLSHEPYGWLLVTDLWRQFRAWIANETPPGGVLTTNLATHHAIAGVMVRVTPRR
jgi:hypothetical protein